VDLTHRSTSSSILESFFAAYLDAMPKPTEPDDLTWCVRCRKVIGPHKGWFGPECQCNAPKPKPREGPVSAWG
jgi:hypothetical protein